MKDLTDITFILDRSGSMSAIQDETIKSFNDFLEEQKKLPGEAVVSLCQFDDQYDNVYSGKPVAEAPKLNSGTFLPRGSTALLDAIGRTIIETGKRLESLDEHDRPARVLLTIITDGYENASREYDKHKINEMISHQRDKYSWTFVFLGADQDAISTASGMGISPSNCLAFVGGMGAASPVADKNMDAKNAIKRLSSSTEKWRSRAVEDLKGSNENYFDEA